MSAMRNTCSHNIVVQNSPERSNTGDEYTNVSLKLSQFLKEWDMNILNEGRDKFCGNKLSCPLCTTFLKQLCIYEIFNVKRASEEFVNLRVMGV